MRAAAIVTIEFPLDNLYAMRTRNHLQMSGLGRLRDRAILEDAVFVDLCTCASND